MGAYILAGKLVSQLFGKVQDMLEGDHSLLFILIDEAGMHAAPVVVGCQHAGGWQEACMQSAGHQHAVACRCGAAAG
jgi:hypothetical protein